MINRLLCASEKENEVSVWVCWFCRTLKRTNHKLQRWRNVFLLIAINVIILEWLSVFHTEQQCHSVDTYRCSRLHKITKNITSWMCLSSNITVTTIFLLRTTTFHGVHYSTAIMQLFMKRLWEYGRHLSFLRLPRQHKHTLQEFFTLMRSSILNMELLYVGQ